MKIWINISVRHQKNTCSFRYDITDNTCTLNFVKSCAGCAFLDIESICKRSQWPLHGGPDAVYTKKNISLEILFWRCFIIIIMKLFVSKCKPERCWILLSIYRYRNPLKVKANRQTKLLLVYVTVLESILVFTFRFCGLYHVHWRIFVFAREIWYTCVSYPIVSIILAAEFEIWCSTLTFPKISTSSQKRVGFYCRIFTGI